MAQLASPCKTTPIDLYRRAGLHDEASGALQQLTRRDPDRPARSVGL
jgi:hypothetical protein